VTIHWFVNKRERPLFGPGGSLGIEYRDVITDYDPNDMLPEGAVEELFTEAEAKAFCEFLNAHRDYTNTEIKPYSKFPISNSMMGLGATPMGGGIDNLMTGDAPDYNLPFKVYGYYDLNHGYERQEDVANYYINPRSPFSGMLEHIIKSAIPNARNIKSAP
jgi:hypothetical protein